MRGVVGRRPASRRREVRWRARRRTRGRASSAIPRSRRSPPPPANRRRRGCVTRNRRRTRRIDEMIYETSTIAPSAGVVTRAPRASSVRRERPPRRSRAANAGGTRACRRPHRRRTRHEPDSPGRPSSRRRRPSQAPNNSAGGVFSEFDTELNRESQAPLERWSRCCLAPSTERTRRVSWKSSGCGRFPASGRRARTELRSYATPRHANATRSTPAVCGYLAVPKIDAHESLEQPCTANPMRYALSIPHLLIKRTHDEHHAGVRRRQ